MIELVKILINNLGYIILLAFIVSRSNSFKNIIQKDSFKKSNLITLSIIFGTFGILGTYVGINVNGAIVNSRVIGVLAGGILCGPFVGISSGIITAIHRILIDVNGITSLPCSINTLFTGVLSGYLYKKTTKSNRWVYGFLGGIISESLEMIFILLFSKPFSQALLIVKTIYVPMAFINGVGISILVSFIQNLFEEKEEIEAMQAKTTLEIANKTLPYFRDINDESLDKICSIIKDYINADAVSITDSKYVLSHVGLASDHHIKGKEIITEATKKVITSGEILCLSNSKQINCPNPHCPFNSAVIAPIKDGNKIIGALKIYYSKKNAISFKNTNLSIGLSQIISTQLEISKISKLRELASKAELKALQSQINPHFLFNALNTIVSFIRINPSKARELIIDLSTYLRHNLDSIGSFVNIQDEVRQVKAYVEIEKARFGDKLNFLYDIDNVDIKIPNLIIQPIVENAIKHGILEGTGKGTVYLIIKAISNSKIKIIVEDDGVGISQTIIEKIYKNNIENNKIGLSNVNNRLKNIYGKGILIERLPKGTRMSFFIHSL